MVRSPKLTQPFDRNQDFVVLKAFSFNGRTWQPNAMFDKTTATDRKLRQLYESRYLRMVGASDLFDGALGPRFDSMPDTALREWLTANTGHVPHELATRERLIARAKRRWHELQAAEAVAATGSPSVGDAMPPPPQSKPAPAAPITMEPFTAGEKPVDQPAPIVEPEVVVPLPKIEAGRAASKTPVQRRRLVGQSAGASRRDA